MISNFKIKYQGLTTMWVYKDQTNPKEMLKKQTYIIYKKGSGFELAKGRWEYEPNTKEILVSWTPLKLKTIKIKNPKICFFSTSHFQFSSERKEDCFRIANKRILKEFQADNKIQVSARKSTNNNPESKTKGENDEQ